MEIDCPNCGKVCEVDREDLPEWACDSTNFECSCCEHVFKIGWYAEIELR
jgi:hypothetical protein